MRENLQRRSFFRSLVGIAAVSAVPVAAKVVEPKVDTVSVSPYCSWTCQCGSSMINQYNQTMRCTFPTCKYFGKVIPIPRFNVPIAASDEYALIRLALILLGLVDTCQSVSTSDYQFCGEMLTRYMQEAEISEAHFVRPHDFAYYIAPYYHAKVY